MHEKEILENLARSGRLASQTHKRALTHSLLNKALHCSLIHDSNVSSNSDSQPPADTSTARYDRFRQQSHFCCTCESNDCMAKFRSRQEHHAFNRDLPEKVCHHCCNCQQTGDQDMVTGDASQYVKMGNELEDAGSNDDDDEYQQRVQRSTSIQCEEAPGTGYLRETGGCPSDDPYYTAQKVQQPALSQPIRGTTVINMNASREDKTCSSRETSAVTPTGRVNNAVTPAGHVNNEWCQRCGGGQGYRNLTDYQQCRRCSCPQQVLQTGQDLTTQGGKCEEHTEGYLQTGQDPTTQGGKCEEHTEGYLQNVAGRGGDLRQSSYNLQMNRRAEPRSESSSGPRCMKISESKMYRRTDEGELFVSSHGDQQYNRQDDQLCEKPENRMYRRSEEVKYRRTEGQEYRKPSEGLQYKKPEGQEYRKPSEGLQYKKPEGQEYRKPSEGLQYKKPEGREYRNPSEGLQYKKPADQEYRNPSEGLQYKKLADQTYKATYDESYKNSVEGHVSRKQNSELLNERRNEGQKYKTDVHQQTDTNEDLQPESSTGSQWYETAASDRSRLPEDNREKNTGDLDNEEVNEAQPRLESQFQKIRDILLHQNTEEKQERTAQENVTPKGEQYVEKDRVNPQNRSSSDQKYTRTNGVEKYGGNTSEGLQEESFYSPQSKSGSRIQQFMSNGEIPQSERVSLFEQSSRLSEIPQSERVSRIQQSEITSGIPQSVRVSEIPQPDRVSEIPQSERVSHIQQSLRTDDNSFRKSRDIPESEVVTSNQRDMRTNPQSKRVTIDQQFWKASSNWSSERTTFDQQSKTPSHIQHSFGGDDLMRVIPQSERVSRSQQSERVSRSQQSERVSRSQQSERTGDDPQSERASRIQPSMRASEIPQSERVSHIQPSLRASEIPQSERVSRIQQSMRASEFPQSERVSYIQPSLRASEIPQSERVSRVQQSMRASEIPQSKRVSHIQQSIGDDDDNQFVKSRDKPQSERASRNLQSVRTVDNKFINSNDISQSEKVSLDQQYVKTQSNSQSEKGTNGPQYPRTTALFINSNDNPQSEKVTGDQQYTRTNNKLFGKSSQEFDRTSRAQQNVGTHDCPCSRTSDNLYVRPSDNQQLRTSGHQELIHPESEGKLQGYRDCHSCRTCSDNQQYTNSMKKPQHFTDKGDKTVSSLCKFEETLQGQRCQTQNGGILKDRQTVWSRMEEAELQDKENFDAAMKQMSEHMNSISQVCECYYDSCSKDGLSLLERRHLRMFHKGVLPCRQQPKKKLDTASSEETSYSQPHCPCSASVNRLQREDKSLSENRPRGQGRMPSLGRTSCTDRSQNHVRFSESGPRLDPDLEDDSESENTVHRVDNSQTAGGSQTAGKPQFYVRFSDTGAEPNQMNKNSHYPETSETCSSSLTSGSHQKDIHGSTSSHEDKTLILSTESATDNTWNSQSDQAGLATCTSSSDSCQPASSSLKHQAACAQKSGHKGAVNARHSCPAPQKQKPTFRSHLRQGVFIEGVSAFPTKVSKIPPKSSKSKARSDRIGSEQGIFITTKPGSYIVKKPKEDSSIHLLQVNPGNYVKLNM